MGKRPKNNSLNDNIDYKRISGALAGICRSYAAREEAPLCWDKKELVRFFKRLGGIPTDYSNRKASLRVLLAVKEIARHAEAPVPDIYRKLSVFTASDEHGLCLDPPLCPRCPLAPSCPHASRTITIKELPREERPRERLLAKGPHDLSDSELLAILIGGGNRDENAVDLSRRLMAAFRNLKRIEEAPNKELETIKGIGKARIARLRAAFAIGRRCRNAPLTAGTSIKGSRQVFEHYSRQLSNRKKEMFICVLLNTRHRIIYEEQVAVGSLNESLVHPREVFKRAVTESAHAVLFVHNHPSGNPDPSPQDHNLTIRLVQAGELMGIKVLDHLIVGKESYYSFAENGTLKKS